MSDDVKAIMDSMDHLQQQLKSTVTVHSVHDAAARLLSGETKKSSPKTSKDRQYLQDLIAEADHVAAMLAGIN